MCYSPIKIFNNAHTINRCGYNKLFYYVPCGQCCECQQNKSDEWQLRSYYQSLETLKNHGYIIFDTLTYSENYVPRASALLRDIISIPREYDFTCFNRKDFTDFMKLLRIRLKRLKIDNSNVKYFVSGEYGTSERGTHRPHYHVIFYVTADIEPIEFSKLVSDCWKFGRTDGVKYRGVKSFLEQRVFRSLDSGVLSACQYVAKYVQKDSEFSKIIRSRFYFIKNQISSKFDKNYYNTYSGKLILRKIKNVVNQFHLQSHGFGSYFLSCVSSDELVKNDYLVDLPVQKTIIRKVSLPNYYLRKLFYSKCNNSYVDSVTWQIDDVGIKYKQNKIYHDFQYYCKNLFDLYSNLDSFQKEKVNKLLCGRELSEYAEYSYFYKGVMLPRINSKLPSVSCVVDSSFLPVNPYRHSLFMYNTPSDVMKYGERFFTYVPIRFCKLKHLHSIVYLSQRVIDENKYSIFRDFDKIYRIFYLATKKRGIDKQTQFDEKQRVTKLYKMLNACS